ncbi:MAG: hypothetical protein Q9187_008686, partial [Circinaria calcarea]
MRLAILLATFAGLSYSAPTCTTTCPTVPVIQDGGFESGLTPSAGATFWSVSYFVGSATYAITNPGSTNNGLYHAFTAILYPGPYSYGNSSDTLLQTMHTCPGQNYSVTVDYMFNSTASNNCALAVRYPYKTTTGSVITGSGLNVAGEWRTTASTFQAVSSADQFSIAFSCRNGASNRISVDNIKILPFN